MNNELNTLQTQRESRSSVARKVPQLVALLELQH